MVLCVPGEAHVPTVRMRLCTIVPTVIASSAPSPNRTPDWSAGAAIEELTENATPTSLSSSPVQSSRPRPVLVISTVSTGCAPTITARSPAGSLLARARKKHFWYPTCSSTATATVRSRPGRVRGS